MKSSTSSDEPSHVLLFFSPSAAGFPFTLLHPRFRHIFMVVFFPSGRITHVELIRGALLLRDLTGIPEEEIIAFHAELPCRRCAVPAPPLTPAAPRFPAPLTCVSLAKQLLQIRAPHIITPLQLYRHTESA